MQAGRGKFKLMWMQGDHPVMLYDGICKFCNGAVQWILRYDKRGNIHFAPLQSQFAKNVLARNADLKGVDSVIVLGTDGRIHTKSDAILQLASGLGGAWKLLLVGKIIPRFLRDALYDWVARNRYRFFGKYDSCTRPSPEAMSRFVDTA